MGQIMKGTKSRGTIRVYTAHLAYAEDSQCSGCQIGDFLNGVLILIPARRPDASRFEQRSIASRSGRKSCTAEHSLLLSLLAVLSSSVLLLLGRNCRLLSFRNCRLVSFALTQLPCKVALLCVCVDLGGSRTRLISSLK